MEPLDVLREEHALLRNVLDSLERCVVRIERGGSSRDLPRFVLFLRAFVQSLHGPKEDEILFEAMACNGFSRQVGPIALMTNEHTEACKMLDLAASALTASRGDKEASSHAALTALRSVDTLLRYHMEMEEAVVYPTAESELPPEVLSQVWEMTHADGRDSRASLCAGAMRRLANDLQILYPPVAARLLAVNA
jgi:hemerythrin-like domain-containing protein